MNTEPRWTEHALAALELGKRLIVGEPSLNIPELASYASDPESFIDELHVFQRAAFRRGLIAGVVISTLVAVLV